MNSVILHIPHASTHIPEEDRSAFLLNEADLAHEILRMTDLFTDDLFELKVAHLVVAPVSRLVVDVERFEQDGEEPMASRGMGATYTHTHDGKLLRTGFDRESLLARFYRPHHQRLLSCVQDILARYSRCLIIDCHSFPSSPLPCDLSQEPQRPDICIGTDSFHTPVWLRETTVAAFQNFGLTVEIDRPYAGSLVPLTMYRQDARVSSIMVELNRKCYMKETTGSRIERYVAFKEHLHHVLNAITEKWESHSGTERFCANVQ